MIKKFLTGIALVAVLFLSANGIAVAGTVYLNDFETAAGSEWSDQKLSGGLTSFLGNFTDNGTTLTLTGLGFHTQVTLSFDLYLIGSWDGENTSHGKDYFNLGNDITRSWTFTDHQPQGQSYPGTWDEVISGTEIYRGLDDTGTGDSFTFAHTGDTLSIRFYGTGLTDESFGIDNIEISIDSSAVPVPGSIILLGVGILGITGGMRGGRKIS